MTLIGRNFHLHTFSITIFRFLFHTLFPYSLLHPFCHPESELVPTTELPYDGWPIWHNDRPWLASSQINRAIYSDYDIDKEPRYISQQNGAWEITQDDSNNKFAQQKVLHHPISWALPLSNSSTAVIGDINWWVRRLSSSYSNLQLFLLLREDVKISVDIRFPILNGTDKIFLALRSNSSGWEFPVWWQPGVFFWVTAESHVLSLTENIGSFLTWTSLNTVNVLI